MKTAAQTPFSECLMFQSSEEEEEAWERTCVIEHETDVSVTAPNLKFYKSVNIAEHIADGVRL